MSALNDQTETTEKPTCSEQRPVLRPLEKPLVIDAITCRIGQDIQIVAKSCNVIAIPLGEVKLLIDIAEAAREVAREWAPTQTDIDRGHGDPDSLINATRALTKAVSKEVENL